MGAGLIKIEMYLLPDVYIKCDECNGMRFNSDTLNVLYKGKYLEVLDMTIDEAADFFKNHPLIIRKLNTLLDVGLGYIKLDSHLLPYLVERLNVLNYQQNFQES